MSKRYLSRTSQGVRGLKRKNSTIILRIICRTSQGVRGLKHRLCRPVNSICGSHPAGGAWIETLRRVFYPVRHPVAPRRGCVD